MSLEYRVSELERKSDGGGSIVAIVCILFLLLAVMFHAMPTIRQNARGQRFMCWYEDVRLFGGPEIINCVPLHHTVTR